MDITWNYKIELSNDAVFSDIEEEYGIVIPEEVRNLIKEYNAATPSKYNFMVETAEKVLGAILSFNKEDNDVDTVFTALDVIEDKNLIPFAIDPFGNYICYDVKVCEVIFWNHETDENVSTGKNLEQFLESLY